MDNSLDNKSKTIAESSGFPLQLKVHNIVSKHPKWKVFLEEHPWDKGENTKSNYIDLVIQRAVPPHEFIIIECKRVKDAQWVFLAPYDSPEGVNKNRSHTRIWISYYDNNEWTNYGWDKQQIAPYSYKTKFCSIRGQEQGRNAFLDNTTSLLIESVEALANQDKLSFEHDLEEQVISDTYFPPKFVQFYIPIIVTTAILRVAVFDPANVSEMDGTLPDNTIYEAVPYIRYHKPMSKLDLYLGNDLQQASYLSEQTVFIVNAKALNDFISKFELEGL